MQPFTAADINDLRIGNRHRDGTDRTGWLIVKNRLPRSPVIGRFENAAIDLRHVKDVWLRGNAGHRTSSAAVEWSDGAPTQRASRTLVGREGTRCKGGEQHRQTKEKNS